jgi:6,7-dimethyl-8-ribityllumazine synthase
VKTWPTHIDATDLRFAVVVSRFNHLVSVKLLEGCTRELEKRGAAPDDVHVAWVPGAFEIPLATQTAAQTGRYDALVAIGAVIRGDTAHFEYVCRAVTDGLREIGLRTGAPVAFGVLTTDSVEQALERAAAPGEPGSNKGTEAAEVALEMVSLMTAVRRGK